MVSYRRSGGMAGVDQRVRVYEDGVVAFEDRKARGSAEVQASPAELDAVRAALDAIPPGRWSSRLGALARSLLPRPHEGMRFEVRRGSGWITGSSGRGDADLAELTGRLDELLARAVRERRG